MKIVVVGPGALGCLFAASLRLNSNDTAGPSHTSDIWLFDHNRARAAQLDRTGIILEENHQRHCQLRATTDPDEIGKADLILLCVKAGDFMPALSSITPLLTPNALLITLQNGIGHLPLLEDLPTAAAVALGVTAQGATLLAPGHVRHAGNGLTRIGWLGPRQDSAILDQTAMLLSNAGIETEVAADITGYIWTKLLINIGINALTAIHDCPNGMLLELPGVSAMMLAAVREAETVATAKGIRLYGEPTAAVVEVCRATAGNISSMLQDVRRCRMTEIDAINGALLHEARQLGIAAPVNEELVRQVKTIEKGYGQ